MSESDSYPKAEFFRKPNLSGDLPNVPKCGLNTRHDNREVTWSDSYSIFPKAEFVRIFTECSEVSIFRSVDFPKCRFSEVSIVRSVDFPKCSIFRSVDFPKCRFSEVSISRSVDWTHDMIIVKWHLFIWRERKLCALTNAPPLQSTQTGQWQSTLFHANSSAAQVYVLYPRQFIFALSCSRHHFCRYYNPQSARKHILKNFLFIWWWQMLWWKHVSTRKL